MLCLLNPIGSDCSNREDKNFQPHATYFECTIVEMMIRLMNVNAYDLPEHDHALSSENKFKAYTVSLIGGGEFAHKSTACYRSKLNQVLVQVDKLERENVCIIEAYEHTEKPGTYTLRRLNVENYMKSQNIECDEELPPELLLLYA